MLAMFLVSLVAALVLCCLLFPSMWATMACDEILDAHEAGLALVSSSKLTRLACPSVRELTRSPPGNPVSENGPPACMAKLIMLRHKVCRVLNSVRRRSTHSLLFYPADPPGQLEATMQRLARPPSGVHVQYCPLPTTAQRSMAVRSRAWQAILLLKRETEETQMLSTPPVVSMI